MTTEEKIRPIIERTYGRYGEIHGLLLKCLADKIDAWQPRDEGRQDMIRETCWNWFSGGSTAALVAKQVEEALRDV